MISVPAYGIAQAYLSACSHAASSQPHSVCALTWSTACHIPYMYDLDIGLNHAAEASQVDLYRSHGASSLANISKDSVCSPSLLFGLIPYSQPRCLIACGPISSIAKDPLYAQGSDAGICTSDYGGAGTSIASSLVILPGFQAETVKLHKGVEGVRQ